MTAPWSYRIVPPTNLNGKSRLLENMHKISIRRRMLTRPTSQVLYSLTILRKINSNRIACRTTRSLLDWLEADHVLFKKSQVPHLEKHFFILLKHSLQVIHPLLGAKLPLTFYSSYIPYQIINCLHSTWKKPWNDIMLILKNFSWKSGIILKSL